MVGHLGDQCQRHLHCSQVSSLLHDPAIGVNGRHAWTEYDVHTRHCACIGCMQAWVVVGDAVVDAAECSSVCVLHSLAAGSATDLLQLQASRTEPFFWPASLFMGPR